MLNYRYHALSLVAVFLALLVGLLLGVAIGDSGLVSSAERDVRASLRKDVRAAQSHAADLQRQLVARARIENAAYPALVAGLLPQKRVAVVQLGGSSDRLVDDAKSALQGSGATLESVAAVREPLDLAGLAAAAGNTRYKAVAGDQTLVHPFGTRLGIQLTRGGDLLKSVQRTLLSSSSGTFDGADAVILMRAPPKLGASDQQVASDFEDGLVRGLRAHGVPVIGVEGTSTSPSQVPWFHGHGLSSVDDVDDILGRAAVVFALAGDGGTWGVKPTADAVLPPLLAGRVR